MFLAHQTSAPSSFSFSCPHHSANKSFLDGTCVPAPRGRGSDSSLAVPRTAERGESHISSAGAAGWGSLASVLQGPLAGLEAMPMNMWWHGGVSEPSVGKAP